MKYFQTGFSFQDLRSSFPLLISLMNKYEIALRKPISVQFHAKKKDLPKWPFLEMFEEVFKEAHADNISLVMEELNQMISEAKMEPTAVCRYERCGHCFDKQAWSGLLSWSSFIREKDVDYKGFYRLTCQDHCKIEFHPHCWKEQKSREELKNDKDFLNMPCLTPDCNGVIIEIVRFQGSKAKPVILKADQSIKPSEKRKVEQKSGSNPVAEDSSASLLNLIKEHIDKEVEHSRVVNDLKAENEKLTDQLSNARHEARTAKESLKQMQDKVNKSDDKLNKMEDKIRNVNADIKAERDKYRRLENEFKKARDQQEYQLNNELAQQNLKFIELLQQLKSQLPEDSTAKIDFPQLINQVQKGHSDVQLKIPIIKDVNCNEEKKPNLLDKILLAAQQAFPRQSKDNILTMIMEIKRNHGGLKSLTMNKLITEMQDMLNSNDMDDECSICLESLSDHQSQIIELRCKHEFHLDCIHKYFAIKMECPLCRSFEILDEEFPSLGASLNTRKPRHESASSSVNSI